MNNKNLLRLLVLGLALAGPATAQTKRALIFAISNYPPGKGWGKIASDNDVHHVEKALQSQKFTDINVVPDATVDQIKGALQNLIAESAANDIVVIHFSSHGELIMDEKHIKTNGLEPSIVGWGAQLMDARFVTQDKFNELKKDYFREDDFGAYVKQLRRKLGKKGDLAIFMDLCHAGVGTRGIAVVRGGNDPLVTKDFKNNPTAKNGVSFDVGTSAGDDETDWAPVVVIGAASERELDTEMSDDEGKGVGPLSYAISKVFANRDNVDKITYRALFAQIKSIMNVANPYQHPVLDGNGADNLLFASQSVPQQKFMEINSIGDKKIEINAGTLSGMDIGAIVGVYPSGVPDTVSQRSLASGKVISAKNYTAIVQLDKALTIQPALGWVFVKTPIYKFDPIRVQIVSKGFAPDQVAQMKRGLRRFPLLSYSDQHPDLRIAKGADGDSIVIVSSGHLYRKLRTAADTAKLDSDVLSFLQYQFLKKVNINEAATTVEVRLVRVVNGKPDTSDVRKGKSDYDFYVGDTVRFWVNNPTDHTLFVNLLDLQPDGQINAVVPHNSPDPNKQIAPDQAYVKPGRADMFGNPIRIDTPLGTEVIKVFVSTRQLDMSTIATLKGAGVRGRLTPFERLVSASYRGVRTRGLDDPIPSVDNGSGSAYNFLFEIREK